MGNDTLSTAYEHCLLITREHYENFPVASFFLPADKRQHLAAVYAYARMADDFADEGDTPDEQRLQALRRWEERLRKALAGSPDHPVFVALQDTIARFSIPDQLFFDLLTAFRQDVTTKRYASYDDVLGYCSFSANPVGRIVLHIFQDATSVNVKRSDAICTALQLTNFWQDVSVDLAKGRVYLPLEDLERFQYNEEELRQGVDDERFRALVRFEVERTRTLFHEGRPLVGAAAPALRTQLALTWNGGMTILRMIERAEYRVLSRRPRLRWPQLFSILGRSILMRTL